jgi:hypothetical protein
MSLAILLVLLDNIVMSKGLELSTGCIIAKGFIHVFASVHFEVAW